VGSSTTPSPKTKSANMEWRFPVSLQLKKFKMGKSAGKLMAMVFWDCKGVLLLEFKEKGTTINADHIVQPATLKQL